ncbi:MAG: helix-hairpin-helix domain-containing protein [Salinivirgaceae bacterium]|nr:helix-hairpin-helix domain-containing protein [Salinivirgaceae bacterium]
MRWILIIALTFVYFDAFCQKLENDASIIEDLIEEIAQSVDEELDYTSITELFYYLLDNPINLNAATESELEQLFILNPFQIKNLIYYRENHGELLTIYELQLIEGFNMMLIQKLLPFITVSEINKKEVWNLPSAIKYGKHEIITRLSSTLEEPIGYKSNNESGYPGNRTQFLNKYRFNYRQNLMMGITAEKDPGEQFFKGNQSNGFDFYSGYLQIADLGIIKKAIVGDYQMQFGQGLVMWSYIANGKSSLVLNTRKRANGIKKFTSADENSFLRGAAATFEYRKIEATVFASSKRFDANKLYDSTSMENYFTSFQLVGIHATENQLEDKDAVQENLIGANINMIHKKLSAGLSLVNYNYNLPFKPSDAESNIFDFSGKSNQNASANFEYRLNSAHFFGEAAISKNGGKALITGVLLQLTSQFNASVLYRNFEKNYQAFFANAFREGAATQNEQGIYFGVEIHPYKRWKISSYYDFYKFPWLTTYSNAPSEGNDFMLQVDFLASREFQMYGRIKHELKQVTGNNSDFGINGLINTSKTSVRYHVDFKATENLKLRNRIEFSSVDSDLSEQEYGYLLYQDLIYTFTQLPLKLYGRYALFDTESYNTRIYTYESDVLQAFSIPAFYDKGSRVYVMVKYVLANKLDIWFRIAQTYYSDKNTIGSGLNEIGGHTKTDVKLQLRYKF